MTRASFGWGLARFCLPAWIGAAVLFVWVGVREVTTPEFTSEIKDRLVTLRFPGYYIAGATLLSCAGAGCLIALTSRFRRPSILVPCLLVLMASGLMVYDYVNIYLPLAALVTPPGKPRTMEFLSLHQWSMRINTLHLVLCLTAALWLQKNPPGPEHIPSST